MYIRYVKTTVIKYFYPSSAILCFTQNDFGLQNMVNDPTRIASSRIRDLQCQLKPSSQQETPPQSL